MKLTRRKAIVGGSVLAAWLDHFDAREQNSMDSWIAAGKGEPVEDTRPPVPRGVARAEDLHRQR